MKNEVIVKILQALYIFIFIFSIGLITAMHVVPAPALAVFRIPTNLREVGPYLGLSWPMSLHIYQIFLLLFLAVLLLNGIGLRRLSVPKWRSICLGSSFLGLFLTWSIFLFFVFPFVLKSSFDLKNLQTSLVYAFLALAFFIVDLLTFFVAQKVSTNR